jgi:hypothetical protein
VQGRHPAAVDRQPGRADTARTISQENVENRAAGPVRAGQAGARPPSRRPPATRLPHALELPGRATLMPYKPGTPAQPDFRVSRPKTHGAPMSGGTRILSREVGTLWGDTRPASTSDRCPRWPVARFHPTPVPQTGFYRRPPAPRLAATRVAHRLAGYGRRCASGGGFLQITRAHRTRAHRTASLAHVGCACPRTSYTG